MARSREQVGNHALRPDYLEQLREAKRGKVRAPRTAAELIAAARFDRLGRKASRLDRFRRAWVEAVSPEVASASDVTSYSQGELRVTVTSQALAHELSVHRAQALVAAMNNHLDGKDRVTLLRVRAGKLKKKDKKDT